MARIRTVKPEFWQHPKVTRVSRDARLLFLGLLNEADDAGKLRYSPKRLAGVLFGDDEDVTPHTLDAWAEELEKADLVLRYEVDGASLLAVLGFTEHQNINRPSPSRLPDPSVNPPTILTEDSVSVHGSLTESSSQERNREQGREQGDTYGELALAVVERDPVDGVFEEWQEATGHHKAVLDRKRRRVIESALKHYPVEDCVAACRGVMLFPHNRGATNGQRYDDITLVLRDSEHIERFRDRYLGEGQARPEDHALLGALVTVVNGGPDGAA